MPPLRQQLVDAIDADQHLHFGADLGMRIVRITAGEQRVVACQRYHGSKMRAGRVAPQRNPRWIEAKLLGLAAHELHRSANVIDNLWISLLARLGERIADREPGISALGQVWSPIVEGVA